MTETELVVTHFNIPERISEVRPLGEGFINDTFIIVTSGKRYILQRKNKAIFPNIPGMMDNIDKVTRHIRQKGHVTLQLTPARDGKWYFLDDENEYWACCEFIENSVCYQTASSPELIYAGGVGIGQFQALLADFEGTLEETLPGFHNIRYRFWQFDDALAKDAAGRNKSVRPEIDEVLARKEQMMDFFQLIENGTIPKRISHNDTKISNFLFKENGEILCAIDLDTVMQSSVLYDFGDAIRSYANVCAEDEKDTSQVRMDLARFDAYTKGYLKEAACFLNATERKKLAFAAIYITFEQFLRFLMDYMNGDTYYKIRYPEHNLVRAQSQLALLRSMESQYDAMVKVQQQY